jgi:asparagine synthetase B (glutamine-hydrolysing)
LSIAFPDPACDEQTVQSRVAQQLSLPLTLVPFAEATGPRGLLREALQLNHGLAAPLFNTWMPIYLHLIRRGREEDVDTILTGEGGDEWLGASPYFTADLMRRGDLAGVVRMARTWHRSYHQDWFTVARGTLWRYGLRPIAGMWCARVAPTRWDDRRANKVLRATPDWIVDDPTLRQARFSRARRSLTPADPPGGFYSREGIGAHGHTLQSWLFEEQFQLGDALGVRYVHPYWDPDLAMHLSRVRPERLNEHDRTKALVRRTLARRFPELGFERQRKVAAMDFFAGILRTEGPALGEAVADFQGLAALGIVIPTAARDFMRRAWTRSPREAGHAWNLVNMETWVRRHLQ